MEIVNIKEQKDKRSRNIARVLIAICGVVISSSLLLRNIGPDLQTNTNSAQRYIDCSMTFLKAGVTRIENTINTEFEAEGWKTQIGIGLGNMYYGPFFVCPNRLYLNQLNQRNAIPIVKRY